VFLLLKKTVGRWILCVEIYRNLANASPSSNIGVSLLQIICIALSVKE
jgi:hypothetical protein